MTRTATKLDFQRNGNADIDPVDGFSLDELVCSTESVREQKGKRKPPRHRHNEMFAKGPLSYRWLTAACRLPGSGLHVVLTYWFLTSRYAPPCRWPLRGIERGLGLSDWTVRNALRLAESSRLLDVVRDPGRRLAVSPLDHDRDEAGKSPQRPLYGPIPWKWLLPALRLPGKAAHSAMVVWLLAGWERSAQIDFLVDNWTEFGLTRHSASRGLAALEAAGLVTVQRRCGRPPLVTILDVQLCTDE